MTELEGKKYSTLFTVKPLTKRLLSHGLPIGKTKLSSQPHVCLDIDLTYFCVDSCLKMPKNGVLIP
jgi:hypothetical protein